MQFEDVDSIYCDESFIVLGLERIAADYGLLVGGMALVFCSDLYILEINKQFLNHDYYTDIITFDYSESSILSGDLIVSLDTVRTNSLSFSTEFNQELFRVLIHGFLHLCGLGDKTDEEILLMRNRESFYLDALVNPFVSRETF